MRATRRSRQRGTSAVVAALVGAAGLMGCSDGGDATTEPTGGGLDIHSYARPEAVRVAHMGLWWNVEFEQRKLIGTVTLLIERGPGAADEPLVLDTKDLDVYRVTTGRLYEIEGADAAPDGVLRIAGPIRDTGPLAEARWSFGERDERLGTALRIDVPADHDVVRINYGTSPSASGLQWLDGGQTAGGEHPFLYSQSQAIHGRSWIPCQDSPAVRVTYDAELLVDDPLRAVMAAEQDGEPGELTPDGRRAWRYVMPQPIPSYLIALGVGELEFRRVGRHTGVWAEPPVVEAAASEFRDMERMLKAVEPLYGPYRWGRFDVLVLPPSFPFGGMENPRLTFATPTVIAGDRSLVALIAHELAHSWSGNLVTNATWADLWLNEGFTVYIERRIVEELYGREREEMEAMLGRQDLVEDLADLPPADQILQIDLAGRDPDDGFSDVPYEKGALFLRRLEELYGREAFDVFLREWFEEHAFTSVTSATFLEFLDERLLSVVEPIRPGESIDVVEWVTAPGLPADAPQPTSDALDQVDVERGRWESGAANAAELVTDGWTTHQWLHFLRGFTVALTPDRMADLDAAFGFTASGNSEIVCQWLILSVRHGYQVADERLHRFLTEQGRRKFLKPLYEELMGVDGGPERARELYAEARPGYQAISRGTIDAIVGWDSVD